MDEVAGKKKATRGRKKLRIVNHDHGRREWSDLPKELVELFTRRLLYVDQIYLRATCKSWHSVGRVPILSQKKHMPWLLGIEHHSSWSSCKLYDPTYRKAYTIDMSSLKKKIECHMHLHANESKSLSLQVHESKSGWMLLSLNSPSWQHHFTMYSPFFMSNNLLELPVLATTRLVLATFSHSNMYEDSSSYHDGFSFVALSYGFGNNTLQISTSKWGDNTWTSTRDIRCQFPLDDITWLYSQGRFYYATKSGQVGSLCVDGQEWSTLQRLDRLQYDNKDPHMMMSDEGELYLFTVSVRRSWIQWSPIYLDAYRLNLSSHPHNTKTWELIESLGQDRALFLDSCKSSPKLISNTPREVANRVYFCSGNEALKTAFYSISGNSTRSYPCLKHYGSLSNEYTYEKVWVEPPEY